ncbi:hypothetical protein QFC21_003000 [Naganishia friedmannii]|uniref:Uncharacterized protein n=1 Tax=Naganishia friedmannii TaxID=89922 RepID=A0ACC2VUC5_9TREE|nr:hypothetical protein QFC21_003000 [Naganishia friedmannii]
MVPFGRPKRKVQEVQDDDISLADLPQIQAESQVRRGSEGLADSIAASDFRITPTRETGEIGYQTDRDDIKPKQDYPLPETTVSVEDTYRSRKGYALSSSGQNKIDMLESERWQGTAVNERRDESRFKKIWRVSMRHLRFVGPGLVSSVAYFDPGNWTVDLAAGSEFGYKLLSVILMAGIGAAVLQVLSLRLGIATSMSLPAQIRALFLRIREHPRVKPYRWRRRATMAGLYGLYALAEIAIIATDLAELLGSAIALNLIFPQLPLYAGVLITAVDVLFVLAFFQKPEGGRKGMMAFEGLIVSLIKPDWPKVFQGFIPSSTIIGPKALYTSVGIIGATVMPHALFLGSHLATVDRLDVAPRPPLVHSRPFFQKFARKDLLDKLLHRWRPAASSTTSRQAGRRASTSSQAMGGSEDAAPDAGRTGRDTPIDEEIEHMIMKDQVRYEAEMNTFDRVKFASIHIGHATIDTVLSLFGFAVTINSSILILASAAFFYGGNDAVRKAGAEADLFSAHDLIEQQISKRQSASITATLSGQVVSEGFIEWKTSPFVRRIVTRLLGVIPSTVVAIAVGRDGLNQMLVASQVMLSIVLPFVIAPLVYLTSQNQVMMVKNGGPEGDTSNPPNSGEVTTPTSALQETSVLDSAPTAAASCNQANSCPPSSRSGSDRIQPAPGNTSQSFVNSLRSMCDLIYNLVRHGSTSRPAEPECDEHRSRSFKSHWSATAFGWALCTVVTIANAYVLLMLVMG